MTCAVDMPIKTPKRTPAKTVSTAPVKPRDGRGAMSVLEREAFALKRKLLLDALTAADWSPTKAAEALELTGGSATVLRLIKTLDLEAEYETHRPPPGRRPKT